MNEKDIDALIDMFSSDGWKVFTNSLEEIEGVLKDTVVDNAVTNDQWQYARGTMHQLRKILGYETFIRLSLEQQQEPEEADPDVDII